MISLFGRKKNIEVLSPLEGYNRWASTYQDEQNPIKILSDEFMLRNLPNLTGKKFLDAGCGTGALCKHAEKQNALAVHGMDLSPEMIAISKSNCVSGTFQCGSISQLILKPCEFDVVVCALVLGHIE